MKEQSKGSALFRLILILAATVAFCFLGINNMRNIKLGLDLDGGVSITYQAAEANPSAADMADTIYKLQKRAEGYSNEASVYQEGSNRINIDIPGVSDANTILQELGKPGSLQFVTFAYDESGNVTGIGDIVIEGADVQTAGVAKHEGKAGESDSYEVGLTLNSEGAKKFADATTANVGKQIAIIYDDEIVSAPVVNEPITGGQCSITGNFDYDTAFNLASTIRLGALKLELNELRSNVVGARLGQQAIATSLKAGLIGFLIVIAIMLFVYRVAGLAASVALSMYVGLILILLDAFEITLTLPGIAGIILSIGMAVDANVIIFSRVREEIGRGSKVPAAIDAGFSKALSAIIDGNVTTLIAAVVLFAFGSGTVKGFATTLALGIVLSMITALFITRLLIKSFYALGFKDAKWYGKTEHKKDIDFLSKRHIFFAASCAVVVIGIAAMIINASKNYALNYSLDFIGGTSTDVTFNETRSIEQLETEVEPVIAEAIGSTDITLTPVVGGSEVIIKTQELTQDQREALYKVLEEKFSIDTSTITYENISGVVSAEMARSAVISVILATIAMLLYIWIRFRDIRFAGSSIMALVHDVLVVLACYAVFHWTVGNTFIACMLTLVGYSINATIVIFDRIRENISLYSDSDLKMIVNKAITDTLGRSIYTSLTTFVMVAALYIFGVTSIREFALPLMVGILVGGYSSVCLAGAFWYTLRTKFAKKSTTPAKSTKNVKNAKKK